MQAHLSPALPPGGVCPLRHWGVIAADGPEAAHFLHQQLTQDLILLPEGQARLAGFCNAKGRLQASFVAIKTQSDQVLLVLPLALLERTLKRLRLFVLRAKVQLSDASAQWTLRGLLGQDAQASAHLPPWQTQSNAPGVWQVALPPAQWDSPIWPRALWLGQATAPAPEPTAHDDLWTWSDVAAAVPLLDEAVFEAFVPQMLNYESVGGVNFKKGCYPGQEVVARSQFRGTLKRRMARVHSPVALASGQAVFTPTDAEQACGTVVLAAPRPDGQGWDALVSATLESVATGWHLGEPNGPPLTHAGLPYPLLEDI